MKLTPNQVKASAPRAARYEVADGGGLYLVVYPASSTHPQGRKRWQLRLVRDRLGSIRHTLGEFPEMSLAAAREARDAEKARIIAGERSATLRTLRVPVPEAAPAKPQGMTVRDAWDAYMRDEGDKKVTATAKQSAFDHDIAPAIGDRALLSLRHRDIAGIIQAKYDALIEEGGKGVAANRLRGILTRFLTWCRTNGRTKTGLDAFLETMPPGFMWNPAADVCKLAEETRRDRILSDRELGWFFRALAEVGYGFASPFEMILRTMCRRAEIMTLDRDFVSTTEEEGLHLDLPGRVTKNGLPHVVWLHPSAAALLPANLDRLNRPLVWTVDSLACSPPVDRIRAKMAEYAAAEGREAPERWTLHDLRRTGATNAARFRAEEKVIKALLNHTDGSVTGIYNRYRYYDERREALAKWNDYLDTVKARALGENVETIRRAA